MGGVSAPRKDNIMKTLYAVFYFDDEANDVCIHGIFDSKAKAAVLCITDRHMVGKFKLNEDLNKLNKEPKWFWPKLDKETVA